MLYVIYAAENQFQGLHGIEDFRIEDCENDNAAADIGEEMSLELINDFSCVYSILEEDYEESINDDMTEKEKDEIHTEIYNDDIYYSYWKIKEDICKNYTVDLLEEMLEEDLENFVKNFCE
jgi:hypothetical protein